MAHNGAGTDDETWEDASDVYEIRSEAGESEPGGSEEHDSDDDESSVPEDVENPRDERQGGAVGRSPDPVMERGARRGPTIDLRGSSTQTPPSDYQMAMHMGVASVPTYVMDSQFLVDGHQTVTAFSNILATAWDNARKDHA